MPMAEIVNEKSEIRDAHRRTYVQHSIPVRGIFCLSFMHDQKVHSFKIASALFPPIASVSTFNKISLESFDN